MLYRCIELPSDEPVQYVGCYVLKWGKVAEPTVGFVELDEDFFVEFTAQCQRYPKEPVLNILENLLAVAEAVDA